MLYFLCYGLCVACFGSCVAMCAISYVFCVLFCVRCCLLCSVSECVYCVLCVSSFVFCFIRGSPKYGREPTSHRAMVWTSSELRSGARASGVCARNAEPPAPPQALAAARALAIILQAAAARRRRRSRVALRTSRWKCARVSWGFRPKSSAPREPSRPCRRQRLSLGNAVQVR